MSLVSRTMDGTCLADNWLLISDLTFFTSSFEKLTGGREYHGHMTTTWGHVIFLQYLYPAAIFKNNTTLSSPWYCCPTHRLSAISSICSARASNISTNLLTQYHHILITCKSHVNHILITCKSHFDHILITFWSHANHTLLNVMHSLMLYISALPNLTPCGFRVPSLQRTQSANIDKQEQHLYSKV